MLTRLIDMLNSQEISAVFTSLTAADGPLEAVVADVSSLMDTWIVLRTTEVSKERNREIYVLKSRGMDHSNQIREFVMTNDGVHIVERARQTFEDRMSAATHPPARRKR